MIFVERPISAFFLFLCLTLLAAQVYVRLRKPKALAALDDAEERRRDRPTPRSELLVVQGPVASRPSKDERRSRQQELQAKKYFDERATPEMVQNRHASKRTVQGSLAHPGRILAMRARSAGFLAERRSAGLSVTPPYDLVGCHAMGLAGIELSDCPVDEAAVLFPPGDGFKRAMAGVDVARTLVAALCCGMMEALLDRALAATNDRRHGSPPLVRKPSIFRAAMAAGGRRDGSSRRATVVLCCGIQARSR